MSLIYVEWSYYIIILNLISNLTKKSLVLVTLVCFAGILLLSLKGVH